MIIIIAVISIARYLIDKSGRSVKYSHKPSWSSLLKNIYICLNVAKMQCWALPVCVWRSVPVTSRRRSAWVAEVSSSQSQPLLCCFWVKSERVCLYPEELEFEAKLFLSLDTDRTTIQARKWKHFALSTKPKYFCCLILTEQPNKPENGNILDWVQSPSTSVAEYWQNNHTNPQMEILCVFSTFSGQLVSSLHVAFNFLSSCHYHATTWLRSAQSMPRRQSRKWQK